MQTGWCAGAYLTADRIVVYSMSRTWNNIGWYNQPVFVVDRNAADGLLGVRLREALSASTWDSRDDDSQTNPPPILRAVGARSWRDLEKRSKHVCIDTDRRVIHVLPSRWATKAEGGRGFVGLPEIQIEVAWDASDAELGSAVLRGFEASQSKEGN